MERGEEEALWGSGDLSRVRRWLIEVGTSLAEPRFYAVWRVPGRPELRGVHCADGYQAYNTIRANGSFTQARWRACDTAIEAAVVYRREALVHNAPLLPELHLPGNQERPLGYLSVGFVGECPASGDTPGWSSRRGPRC
jgi:hypothetical protein